MFAKLFKYDFKAIARMELPALFALLCITVIGCLNTGVLCISTEHHADFLTLLSAGGFMLTVTTFGGLIMVMSLVIYVRFYKSTVTDEAYTTFTLPAKPSQILGAKFLSAFTWTILVGAAYVIAVLLVCLTVLACMTSRSELNLIFDELQYIGKSLSLSAGTVVSFVLCVVVSSVSQILQVFTAILFGASVVRRYKALAAVGMIFVINFAVNLINSVFGFTAGGMISSPDGMTVQIGTGFTAMMISQTVILAVIAVVCWIASAWLMKNRVNLD